MKNQLFQIPNYQQVLNISQDQVAISTKDGISYIENQNIKKYVIPPSQISKQGLKYYVKNYLVIREVGKISFFNKKSKSMQLRIEQTFMYKTRGFFSNITQQHKITYFIQEFVFQQSKSISATLLIKNKIIRNIKTNVHLNQNIYYKDVIDNFIILNDYGQNQIILRQVVNFQRIIIKIPEYQFINNNENYFQSECSQDLQFFLVTVGNESILFDQNSVIQKIFVYGQIRFSQDSKYIVVFHHLGHIGKFELYRLKDQKFIKTINFDDQNGFEMADIIVMAKENIQFKNKLKIQKKFHDRNFLIVWDSLVNLQEQKIKYI